MGAFIVIVAESGKERRLRASTSFSLGTENVRPDAGRDGRPCLARSNSQARTGTGKNHCRFPCSADHRKDWQLVHILLNVITQKIKTN